MRLPVVFACLFAALVPMACGGEENEPGGAGEAQTPTPREPEVGEDETGTATGCDDVPQPEAKREGNRKKPRKNLDRDKNYDVTVRTNCGEFTFRLDVESAPNTAASFVALAEDDFFDDTVFHRIVTDFVIQGGDPTGTGTGGPGYKTVDEPPSDARYTKGVVAMAKAGNEPPGTAGSQFYVVTAEDAGLPPDYAVLGKVTKGLDVVERIGQLGSATQEGTPTQVVVIQDVSVETS